MLRRRIGAAVVVGTSSSARRTQAAGAAAATNNDAEAAAPPTQIHETSDAESSASLSTPLNIKHSMLRPSIIRDQKRCGIASDHSSLTNHRDEALFASAAVDAVDGNQAVAHVAYALSDIALIYPITPATAMGETCDAKAAAGVLNVFGQKLSVVEMQSEGGVAGALHGAATSGALSVTFTSAQGLLLMIPNMYKIAGQLIPCVMHVATRPLAMATTTMYPDHQDVMAVRQTGWTMIASETPQMAHDMAILAHIASVVSSVPVLHFFDGFRTSHEVNKVDLASLEMLIKILPTEAIERFRATSLSPTRPAMRGMAMSHETFFAQMEAGNSIRDAVPDVLSSVAEKITETVTHRSYAFYAYEGVADAEHVVVVMGSAATTMELAAKHLNRSSAKKGFKCGVVKVRLFRPFCADAFVDAIPTTAKTITVLDRCAEHFATGEPLYCDVVNSLRGGGSPSESRRKRNDVVCLRGRYGIGGHEFTPGMAVRVFENAVADHPMGNFTVGIHDDVTHRSLPLPTEEPPQDALFGRGTVECLFFGLGSDGTVLANKLAVKVINKHTKLHAQAYFQYDAKKSGSLTTSHVRFSPSPLNAPFGVLNADYIAIHRARFIFNFETLSRLRSGGVVVLNTRCKPEEAEGYLPAAFKRQLALKKAQLYFVDAAKIASVCGLGKIINMIMQAVFFKLCPSAESLLPYDDAIKLLIEDMKASLSKKDTSVIANNIQAIELAQRSAVSINIPSSWANPESTSAAAAEVTTSSSGATSISDQYFAKLSPLLHNAGDDIPVSAFTPGGLAPTSTSWREKRGVALQVPKVDMTKCIQCNKCSFVCPHAAIRPFVFTPSEANGAPAGLQSALVPSKLPRDSDFQYTVQVSPLDCTGCQLCTKICPTQALSMRDASEAIAVESPKWQYASSLPSKGHLFDKCSVQGSQYQVPLFEFSAACEGCGETPYIKLLTQLFGDHLVVANATGCSSVYSSWTPSVPYTVNEQGEGPAWGNSLFEDNAEYGFGMMHGHLHRRRQFLALVEDVVGRQWPTTVNADLKQFLQSYIAVAKMLHDNHYTDPQLRFGKSLLGDAYRRIVPLLAAERSKDPRLEQLYVQREMFLRVSYWTIGGDGWAYDIGFGGLDHVLHSTDIPSKLLVLDTEVYSNTGGQRSKATPLGAQAKFAEAGKDVAQKDLARYAMSLQHVYVASVSLHADPEQTVRALLEAEQYPGPALVVCYCPCIAHGMPMSEVIGHAKMAVESGYWPLFRYNPQLRATQNNPFQLDSKKVTADLLPFLKSENRFTSVMRQDVQHAKELDDRLQVFIQERQAALTLAATLFGTNTNMRGGSGGGEGRAKKTVIAYGSETGHAAEQAQALLDGLILRGETNVSLMTLDDVELNETLKDRVNTLLVVVSTTGVGEFPHNARQFHVAMHAPGLSTSTLAGIKYAVFGLGDSTYQSNFCAAANDVDVQLEALGAQRLLPKVLGDEQASQRYVGVWETFEESVLKKLGLAQRPLQRSAPRFKIEILGGQSQPSDHHHSDTPLSSRLAAMDAIRPANMVTVQRVKYERLTPSDYSRCIVHHEYSLPKSSAASSSSNIHQGDQQLLSSYRPGDCLAVHPQNSTAAVDELLQLCGWSGDDQLLITPTVQQQSSELPSMCTVRQLVSYFVDLSCRPTKSLVQRLVSFAKDAQEARALQDLVDNPTHIQKTMFLTNWNCLDLLKAFPSTCAHGAMRVEDMVTLLPRVHPRLYSISSSPHMHPDTIHLTTVKAEWTASPPPPVSSTPDALVSPRSGLCSTFLSDSIASEVAFVRLHRASMKVPPPRTPLILIATGTGIAPWRALIQDRMVMTAKKNGVDASSSSSSSLNEVGPMRLYFGTYSKQEDLYHAEFDLLASGAASQQGSESMPLVVRRAFSHDQPQRIFVQDLLREDGAIVVDWMLRRGATLMMCGAARQAPAEVASTIQRALEEHGGMSAVEAETQMMSWQREGRYVVEVFS